MHHHVLAFFGAPGPMEMAIIGIIALLLFGKRLPEVARSMGKGIVEFRRGMSGIENEIQHSVYDEPTSSRPVPAEEREELTAPKFEPPTAAPQESQEEVNS